MFKWLQEGLNQTSACRAELTLWGWNRPFQFSVLISVTASLRGKGLLLSVIFLLDAQCTLHCIRNETSYTKFQGIKVEKLPVFKTVTNWHLRGTIQFFKLSTCHYSLFFQFLKYFKETLNFDSPKKLKSQLHLELVHANRNNLYSSANSKVE